MKKQKELDRLTKELVKQMTGNEVEDPQEGDYQIAYYYLSKAMDYTHSCTELRDKETPKIEDWLKDNFKRLDRHSFTNIHEDTVWLRSELVEVYNQLHP